MGLQAMGPETEAVRPWSRLGTVDGIPVPSQEMLRYLVKNRTLELQGLALHLLTTLVVANVVAQGIIQANETKEPAQRLHVDPDLTLEVIVAYHATRPLSEQAARGNASEEMNFYMQEHDDIDLATFLAIQERLPIPIIQALEELQRARGFPFSTIGPANRYRPGTIDWTVAITQIASWSVAGTIVPLEARFEDLLTRHAGNRKSPKKLSREELLTYKQWGEERIHDICAHIGIQPKDALGFFAWLRERLDPREQSLELVRALFQREPTKDEFLPVSAAYQYLAKSIMAFEQRARSKDGDEEVIGRNRQSAI